MEMMIWNIILTALFGVLAFMMKEKFAELNRLGILLNRTREEIARDHITRAEFRADMKQLFERFDTLEKKLDTIKTRNNHNGD
jgi:flagellar biosynthesis/type III secretory pathway chaperone